ncbi:hypothetical protein Ahu01nite_035680 [Winogradskya humida]|uniref:Mth938-like domain-containing protein n=1 Tax=Winogradskya humida TaxID=113566 RepID=A0ABQ3ZPF1_9ACTN|nr:hypothetical protein Ahu01nite_035680 [Actinoplanes humidus]
MDGMTSGSETVGAPAGGGESADLSDAGVEGAQQGGGAGRSPRVAEVEWGRIVVAGVGEFKDVIVYPGGGRAWDWRETGMRHRPGVRPVDVVELLERGADVIVLSRGMDLVLQVDQTVLDFLAGKGIEVQVAETREAVRIYNELSEHRAVGALFHSTC